MSDLPFWIGALVGLLIIILSASALWRPPLDR